MSELSAKRQPLPTFDSITSRKERVSTIEFWRFVFTLLVSWYHLEFTATGMGQSIFTSGSSAVEFFFILAGFTIAMSAYKKVSAREGKPMTTKEAHAMAVDFIKKKLIAIYPVLIIVMLFWVFFVLTYPPTDFMGRPMTDQSELSYRLSRLMNTEWEFLFLVGTPFGINGYNAPYVPMWFLTALLVVGYIFTFFVNRYPDGMKFLAPALGLLLYIFFSLSVVANSQTQGTITPNMWQPDSWTLTFASGSYNTLDFASKMGPFISGMVKAAAEMCIGVSVFMLYDHLSKKNFTIFWKIFLSLFEVYAIYRFFSLTIGTRLGYDNVRRIVYIALIVLFSFLNVSLFSRVLNRKFWRHLGHVSLAMYLSHYWLVRPYVNLVGWLKERVRYKPFHGWLQQMGGNQDYDPFSFGGFGGGGAGTELNPMSRYDMIAFGAFITLISAAVMVFIWAFGKYVYTPTAIVYRNAVKKKTPPDKQE